MTIIMLILMAVILIALLRLDGLVLVMSVKKYVEMGLIICIMNVTMEMFLMVMGAQALVKLREDMVALEGHLLDLIIAIFSLLLK